MDPATLLCGDESVEQDQSRAARVLQPRVRPEIDIDPERSTKLRYDAWNDR